MYHKYVTGKWPQPPHAPVPPEDDIGIYIERTPDTGTWIDGTPYGFWRAMRETLQHLIWGSLNEAADNPAGFLANPLLNILRLLSIPKK